MRGTTALLVILVVAGSSVSMGCGSTSGVPEDGERFDSEALQTADGLTRTEIGMPGVLFIRDHHQIGSYDEFLIPEASIQYLRSSRHLPEELEATFLASLEQSLLDAAEEAQIPVVQSPGPCVLQVAMGLVNVDIERASSSTLGRMILAMEFRDTVSGEPLLRYAVPNSIENRGTGEPQSEQIREAFVDMVKKMEISAALRAAGLDDDEIRPGCNGTLAARGSSQRPAVSTK